MLSRSFRRCSWHSLQEFAAKDTDVVAFRTARALAADVAATTTESSATAPKIDWAKYESQIRHQDLVKLLKQHHDTQISQLDAFLKEDHVTAVSHADTKNDLNTTFQDMIAISEKSVEKSEEIVANGAKALYISSNNPSISEVGTSEWLETDQYWAAFVEKHQYYHNHLDCTTEDPESKEYGVKLESDLRSNLKRIDENHPRKAMCYQKSSYEYYNFYKAELTCQMMYYLVKVGGCARLFPELPHFSWIQNCYEHRWRLIEILQRRRRLKQEKSLARTMLPEYTPADLPHGEAYYSKLIQQNNQLTENQVARLMSSFSFLSDAIPVQTNSQLLDLTSNNVVKNGKFYSLGDDVNAVFWKSNEGLTASSVNPQEAWNRYMDHLALSGCKLHPIFVEGGSIFTELLAERKQNLNGSWFNVQGSESTADAFLRRVKKDDPCYSVYESYVAELKSKWENATEISSLDAVKKSLSEKIEAQYWEDLATYETEVLYSSDNNEVKKDIDLVLKDEELAGIVAVGYDGVELNAAAVKKLCTK